MFFLIYISNTKQFIIGEYQDKLEKAIHEINHIGKIQTDEHQSPYFNIKICEIEEVDGKIEDIVKKFCRIVNTIYNEDF